MSITWKSPQPGLRSLLGGGMGAWIVMSQFWLQAAEDRQWIAFEKSCTEMSAFESQAVVRLERFVSPEALQQAFSLGVKVRSSSEGKWGVLTAYFPAGSSSGACTVRAADAVGGGGAVVWLEISDGSDVQGFARRSHVVRKKSEEVVPSGAVIHAVVFSGAETPENAVEGGARGALVEGGIVALGGVQMPPVLFPARLRPGAEYAAGAWTPPLSPQVLVLQFNPWKSNKAP